jgi:hypothetical protein
MDYKRRKAKNIIEGIGNTVRIREATTQVFIRNITSYSEFLLVRIQLTSFTSPHSITSSSKLRTSPTSSLQDQTQLPRPALGIVASQGNLVPAALPQYVTPQEHLA